MASEGRSCNAGRGTAGPVPYRKRSGVIYLLANHQLYDITDIVKEHAAGAIDAVGEDFMKTEVVDGKVYGIPADKGVALAPTLLYREDIMEEIGVDPADIKNINDLTDVYAKVKEAYPDMIRWYRSIQVIQV